MIKIDTKEWLAEIQADAGGNLCRLQHKASGIEILRTPPSLEHLIAKPEMYGIPVLLPPNRIDGGKFRFQGRNYTLPVNEPARGNHLHGLVLGKPWYVKDAGPDYVVMGIDFIATAGFPHDFMLTMSYHFHSEEIIQQFNITNYSSLPMPFGLGFHTAFNMPSDAWATITTGNEYWEIIRPRYLPSGKLSPWTKEDRIFRDERAVSCHCPITSEIIDGKPFRGMIINYSANNAKLYYEVDAQYRHWCLWNNGGNQGFFCAEPMTWMVNAPNLDLPPEITGMQAIEPCSTWRAQTTIRMIRG